MDGVEVMKMAFYENSDLQPPDRRRLLACLAVACMAYPLAQTFLLPAVLLVVLGGLGAVWAYIRQIRLEAERSAKELQNKCRELEQVRRNTASLVEMSVQEERSRIAHEIHDVVGHTLTAAIIQLEGAKRMAEQYGCVPPEKLELLSGLARKGLNDIRSAVKAIRSEGVRAMPLEAALRELIQCTEETMEIAIEADISLPATPDWGRLTEQALYSALQEGLTNGIRHGRCSQARFSLRASEGRLRFRLVNDGEPYGSAVPGFGLSSMIERVKLLGGRVSIRSSADADGNPAGCELSIDLPQAG